MASEGDGHGAQAATVEPAAPPPAERGFFRCMGSLTTSPCSEGPTSTVFKTPIEAAVTRIQPFAGLFPRNARPVRSRHRRFLLEPA